VLPMHPEDLTWLSNARATLKDAGFDPDEINIDDVNGRVSFVYDLEEE
jgi:hypothetical protein